MPDSDLEEPEVGSALVPPPPRSGDVIVSDPPRRGPPPPRGHPPNGASAGKSTTDCLVIIHSAEPTFLGRRFVLENDPTRVGRGADNQILLDGDSVSRLHAHFERRGVSWHIVDDGSTAGTYCNDELVARERILENRDRVKIGATIFKFLSGADVEAQYHEEIYRMAIIDGLTQIHNERYLHEAIEREIIRGRRHERDLSILRLGVDDFKRIAEVHGQLAGDFVLKELTRIVKPRIRRDEVFARCGTEELAIVLPETSLEGATALAEILREKVAEHPFLFQAQSIRITVSIGAALLTNEDRNACELLRRAEEQRSPGR